MTDKRALIIVDVQHDFVEDGSLAINGGRALAARIAQELLSDEHPYELVVTTQDWHIDPGEHFSETPDYVDSWPVHCQAGSHGAELLPALRERLEQLSTKREAVFKGQFEDAYSGFMGTNEHAMSMSELLRVHAIDSVDVIGLALDYCVGATALDAASEGFATRVLKDYSLGINPEAIEEKLSVHFPKAGVEVL